MKTLILLWLAFWTCLATAQQVVTFKMTPENSNLYLNGKLVHTGPFVAKCNEGTYTYKIEAPDCLTQEGTFEVKDQPITVIFKLKFIEQQIYFATQVTPQFPGGIEKMFEFLSQNLVYPIDALSMDVEGKISIQFIVRSSGDVTDPIIIKGLNESCDKEALRVISSMPRWVPGMQDGKPVSSYLTIPVTFKLLVK